MSRLRMRGLAFGIGLALIGSAVGAAEVEQPGARTVIGEPFPLSIECFEAARDGASGARGIAPCDRSLAEEALDDRRRAIVFANRGVVQFNSGNYEAAGLDFTAALDFRVLNRSRVLANRGLAYEVLRYEALARADYREALALNPNNAIANRRLAELEKPYLERSHVPRKINAEAPGEGFEGA
jgi:tetratricopeptide (TPR) repeat protein